MRQQRIGEAGTASLPVQRHNGHAHVECITGRAAARPWVRIKCNVHIEIALHIVCRCRLQNHAREVESEPLQSHACRLHHCRRKEDLRFQQQLRRRHTLHDLAPEEQHLIRKFAVLVEYAKEDMPPLSCRRSRWSRKPCTRHVDELARQTDELLRKVALAYTANRIAKSICQEIVNGLKPGGRCIAKPHHLHRRRPTREHGKRSARRMTRQVNEYINLIRMNPRGNFLRRILSQITPHSGMRTQCRRHLIRILCRTVHIDLEVRVVIRRQQRLHEMLQDIATKIRRNVANADLPVLIGRSICIARDICKQCAICAMRAEEFVRVHILRILCEQKRAVESHIGRLLIIGTFVVFRCLHIAHAIGNGGAQPHELMTEIRAPRRQILLCKFHRTRQIALSLYRIRMKI